MREVTKGTTLIISHQEKILNIADTVVLMDNGKIAKIGKKEDVLNNVILDRTCCKIDKC